MSKKSKEVKKVVVQAKARSDEGLYEELETKEGMNEVIRLAKTRNKSAKDVTHIKRIKNENGTVLKKEENMLKEVERDYEKLLNEVSERLISEDCQVNM